MSLEENQGGKNKEKTQKGVSPPVFDHRGRNTSMKMSKIIHGMKQVHSCTAAWCVTCSNLSRGDLTILIKGLNKFPPSGPVIPLTGICTKEIISVQMVCCNIT